MNVETLIVGAAPVDGAERFYTGIVTCAQRVIACDAAAEWCLSLGRRPDAVVGDFDSATPGAPSRLEAAGIPVIVYPEDKDASDLDLAIGYARSTGATTVCFTAAFSSRLDHTLAALGSLERAFDLMPWVAEPGFTAWLLTDQGRRSVTVSAPVGTTVSLLAFRPTHGVTLTGMKYPLRGASLGVLSSLGISNVMVDERACVSITNGTLLVIVSHDA